MFDVCWDDLGTAVVGSLAAEVGQVQNFRYVSRTDREAFSAMRALSLALLKVVWQRIKKGSVFFVTQAGQLDLWGSRKWHFGGRPISQSKTRF